MKTDGVSGTARRRERAPGLDLWRRMLHLSDVFRLVVNCGGDRESFNRVTVNQARIFGYIFSHGDADIRISKLAHDLDVTPAAAGQAVDRLVQAGLVDRAMDPTDRRAFVISISRKGREHLEAYESRAREVSGEILGGMPEADVAAFGRVLAGLYDGLQAKWDLFLAERDAAAPQPRTSGS